MLIRIVGLFVALGGSLYALSAETCDHSENGLRKYEQRILIGTELFAKSRDGAHLTKITESLACILEIQEKARGSLKYLANAFLRPIFGGPQIAGVPKDGRYKLISEELAKISTHTPLDSSLMAAHARGAWSFYSLFCEQGNIEFCADFLPNEEQIQRESPLLAASSMILLRTAYTTLHGKQKELVAERLRQLYKTMPPENTLKRLVIEQIYSELFVQPVPLSLLS